MATWLNHVTIASPKNGTASHTVTPSAGTVVAGSLFTPAAGRFLVVLVEGAVTSTTPAGWSLGASAVNNTGLYLWYRVAAGSDSLTTTHNGSDYAVVFDIYEFTSGTSFVSAVSEVTTSGAGGVGPTLSGLTGTNWVAGAVGASAGAAGAPGSVTWSAGTLAVSTGVVTNVTDGYTYGLAYFEDDTDPAVSTAATVLPTPGTAVERLMFALNLAPSGSGSITAVRATGTAAALFPAVVRTGAIVVNAASGSAAAMTPALAVVITVTGGGPATATALARVPTLVVATVFAVRATATAQARRPLVLTNLSFTSGPQFVAADGKTAFVLGVWDGHDIQPLTARGYWDGSTVRAL